MDLPNKIDKEPIQHQIDYVKFDFYDPASVKKISIKPLTDPVAFDSFNNPTKGGLHDPGLGVGAYDKIGYCQSCGQNSHDCTGHLGHIELSAILYNPFMLNYILKLMRNKCFFCHKLRITQKDKLYIFMKLMIIKLGFAKAATELKGIIYATAQESTALVQKKIGKFLSNFSHNALVKETYSDEEGEGEDTLLSSEERERQPSIDTLNTEDTNNTNNEKKKKKKRKPDDEDADLEEINRKQASEKFKLFTEDFKNCKIDEILLQIEIFNEQISKNEKLKIIFDQSLNNNIILKEAINEFWKLVKSGKCPHCEAMNSRIKKVGNIKFFQTPFTKKVLKKMKKTGINPHKDALEEGSGHREEMKNKKKKDKNINKKSKNKDKNKEAVENDNDEDIEMESESESEEEEVDVQNEDSHKYLHPMEIKEHIKRLWEFDGDLLSLVFGNIERKDENDEKKENDESNINANPNVYSFKVSSTGPHIFFLESLIVPPNRFRPENRGGADGTAYLHGQTASLARLLNLSNELRNLSLRQKEIPGLAGEENKDNTSQTKEPSSLKQITMKDIIQKWSEMQDTVNILFDSTKAANKKDGDKSKGIKQILEKKEGIYRTKMMGKRVNFAGRSVISPDPMISASEVGIPLYIAQKLVFAETVTPFNREKLQQLVKNGNKKYPGASMIVNEEGRTTSLDFVKDEYRIKLAENLKEGQIVYRHLHTGDALLVNRQPTLHKPSIMSHKARVLPGEKTIRLHYANCNTYNADFDGDEMNIHFLQNHIARQEAYTISNTDNQYIVPTSGKPIRGLIQDSIVSAVFITMKNAFFTREEFFQMVYSCLDAPLNRGTIRKIVVPIPVIIKPKILYTGKQIITTILKSLITSKMVDHIITEESQGINFEHATKLAKEVWGGPDHEFEGTVTVRDNELLTGVLDKNHIGNSEFGLVHSFYEIYGPEMAGELISTFGRLFINYLQFFHGFTCGVDDIILKEESNLKRRIDIENIIISGMTGLANYFEMENFNLNLNNYSRRNVFTRKTAESISHLKLLPDERKNIERLLDLQNVKVEKIYKSDAELPEDEFEETENSFSLIRELKEKYYEIVLKDDTKTIDANVDTVIKNAINGPTSECSKNWLKGLTKTFPRNCFSMMVLSGAKGSLVNHSQITCMLGQQELEGRRVPRMASGRTLPSFEPFDPNPRAGGFVSDRFSTGIRPQEFFFHCMAGREGLIDTAVKTSRSGYLQRCLIKHLEQVVVNYDYTVRDTDGNIIQFLYGEDSIDVMNTRYMTNFKFIADNLKTYYDKYRPERLLGKIDSKTIRKIRKDFDSERDTIMNKFQPWNYLGAVSDKIYLNMSKFIDEDKDKLFSGDVKGKGNKENEQPNKISKTSFKNAVFVKYLNALIQPGESVGILAGQSVGEPSTQMTLNTFHLAGHGGVNMTLGIPRLREILMTSERNIKTPILVLPLYSKDLDTVKKLARNFEKYNLIDIVKEITINQKIVFADKNSKFRNYSITVSTEDFASIESYFNHGYESLISKFKLEFIPRFAKYISKQIKMSGKKADIVSGQVRMKSNKSGNEKDEEEISGEKEEDFESKRKNREEEESDEENADEQEYEDVDATRKNKRNKEDTEETFTDEEDKTDTLNDEETNHDPDAEAEVYTDDEIRNNVVEDDDDESSSENEEKVVEVNGKKIEKISHKRGEKLQKEIDILNSKNFDFENVKIREMLINRDNSSFYFELAIPFNHKNLLLKNMLDHTLKSITFKSVKNINRCHIVDRKVKDQLEYTLQLEGINFDEVLKYMSHIDINRIATNDIGSIKAKYGIEACRAAIVKEINNVFDAYHISVDKRHLGLIADYMTHQGDYRSFNRKGLSIASSPFLKMTFESTMQYMIQSCVAKEVDHGKSASSSIILGQVPKCGTGMFSVLQGVVSDKSHKVK